MNEQRVANSCLVSNSCCIAPPVVLLLCRQTITAALQQMTAFAGQCGTIGPVYALLHHISLAQQLTNCSIDLCSALAAVHAAALRVSPDLQEDLSQHVRQLQRTIGCCYSEQQHKVLLELYVQVCTKKNPPG